MRIAPSSTLLAAALAAPASAAGRAAAARPTSARTRSATARAHTVTGTLVDGTTPLAGQEVVLEGRRYPYEGSYRVIERATTDADGHVQRSSPSSTATTACA